VANSDVEQLVTDCSQRLELANTILEMLDFSCGHNQTSIIQPHHAALGRPGSVKNAEQFTERAHRVVSDILCDQRAAETAVESIAHQFFYGETFIFRSISSRLLINA
jgi:hypothetical protein